MLEWIPTDAPPEAFPPVSRALSEPNGLLAVGGDLSFERLVRAYRCGIFPWYSDDQPILWWCPDPRSVLVPGELRISRSLKKTIRRGEYTVTTDRCFRTVIEACAAPRSYADETWIDDDMAAAYCRLAERGLAHSIETWWNGELVGGLYGVAMGSVFFGESMFSTRSDASKVALVELCAMKFDLIDCQLPNPHLASLGAREIPRELFLAMISKYCEQPNGMIELE